jgi:hypothetical protein
MTGFLTEIMDDIIIKAIIGIPIEITIGTTVKMRRKIIEIFTNQTISIRREVIRKTTDNSITDLPTIT